MSTVNAALWRDMMDYLRKRHPDICRQWFQELYPVNLDAGLLTIHTGNTVQKNYLQRKCLEQFRDAAQSVTGALIAVSFIDHTDQVDSPIRELDLQSQPGLGQDSMVQHPQTKFNSPALGLKISPRIETREPRQNYNDQLAISPDYSFDNFVTGPENRLAHAASIAVSNQPGTAYSPLFIHGGVGLGKTHLLQAICQKVLYDHPDIRICYLSCDAFITDFVNCVQNGQMSDFRQRYRNADLLVIDDIHFLADRERTQEEFFHTFNELYQSKRQIVLSSDSPPAEIPALEERLVSRFQCGLVTGVSRPCYETRLAIVQAKAQLREIEIPAEVVTYIATKIDTNARELEGALITVQGHAALQDKTIDVPLAREALGDPAISGRSTQVSLQHIIDVVTSFYNVKLSELQSKRRHKSIALPRQVCMWLARQETRYSLQEIGGYFGGRDHTTVMHSIKTVDDRLDTDDQFAHQVQELSDRVKQSA
jgi:chromosomal replication initiator protein